MTPSARRVVTQPSQNRAVVTYMFADESPAFSLSFAPVPGCDKAWNGSLEEAYLAAGARGRHTRHERGKRGGKPSILHFFKTLGAMVKDSPIEQENAVFHPYPSVS